MLSFFKEQFKNIVKRLTKAKKLLQDEDAIYVPSDQEIVEILPLVRTRKRKELSEDFVSGNEKTRAKGKSLAKKDIV